MRSTPSKKDLTAPCGLDCFNCTYHRENITGQIIRFKSCKTYNCVTDRGLRFCFECSEFPCPNLQPAADGRNPRISGRGISGAGLSWASGRGCWKRSNVPDLGSGTYVPTGPAAAAPCSTMRTNRSVNTGSNCCPEHLRNSMMAAERLIASR